MKSAYNDNILLKGNTEMSNKFGVPIIQGVYIAGDRFPQQTFMSWLRENSPEHLSDVKFYPAHKNETYLSDYITSDDIASWNADTPVIISAQTGIGKNYFVLKKLLNQLLTQHNQKDTMLLLVNRVALSRQNKFYLADVMKSLVGNFKYEEILNNYYKNEGIDNLCIDFGSVTVCTYHQCYKRKLLQQKNFKYIICDECHFFTSDATFLPETDLMLKEIVEHGSSSVRIYMSATPEIAMEPIMKFEYDFRKSEIVEQINRQRPTNSDFNIHAVNRRANPFMANPTTQILDSNGFLHAIYQPSDVDSLISEEIEKLKLKFQFYYVQRDYSYLNFQAKYSKAEELIPYIEKSTSKWLIFINNNNKAKEFKKKLRERDIACEFISRESVNRDDKSQEEYDYLIANETFKPKVLISTSIIDNGINIKNSDAKKESDKVLNIAVDATNRTQFLQMIGRIRPTTNEQINLYVRDYSLDDIKEAVSRDTEILIKLLYNDFLSLEGQQNNFDKNLFRYISDNRDGFSTYNVCAVHQLINNIASLLKIIRNTEPDFYVELNRNADPVRESVYHSYVENVKDSFKKVWSRSVVDIIESEKDIATREKWEHEELARGVPYNRFKSTIKDTFTKYLFSDWLTNFMNDNIEKNFQSCLKSLDINQTHYNTMCARVKNEKKISVLSIDERIAILERLVSLEDWDEIQLFKSRYKKIRGFIEHFQWLTDDKETTLLEAQCKWLESPDLLDIIATQAISDNEDVGENYDSIESYILNHHVTAKEFEENKCGDNKKKCPRAFLEQHAVLKDSPAAQNLSQKYFDNAPLTNVLKRKWSIGNDIYMLESIISNNGNKTYYIFVKYNPDV